MTPWPSHHKTRYTEIGLRRLKCVRCGAKASAQWQICADNNIYRPICTACDADLNRLVLHWAGHPQAAELSEKYESSQ